MTDIDVSALRAAVEAATPGPWWCDSGWSVVAVAPEDWVGPFTTAETMQRNDAAYIAAASPDVVLALLDEVEALRHQLGIEQGATNALVAELYRARRVIDAVGSLLDGAPMVTQADLRRALASNPAYPDPKENQ